MSANQRARLVLNPLTLVAILAIAGVAAGIGWVMLRDGAGNDSKGPAQASGTSDLALSSDEFDFGKLSPTRKAIRQLLLRNQGSDTIAIRIDGAERVLVEPRTLSVPGGKVGRVFLTADAREQGAWEDELRVVREDGKEDPLVVRLRGTSHLGSNASASADPGTEGVFDATGAHSGNMADSMGEAGTTDASGGDPAAGAKASSGSVQITRAGAGGEAGVTDPATAGDGAGGASASLPSNFVRVPRGMAEQPNLPTGDTALDGEEPVPVDRKRPQDLEDRDESSEESNPGVSMLAVSTASTVNIMGSMNAFYPQQIALLGSPSGGAFTLSASLQIPQVNLAFGQSMRFIQRGAAGGTFDPGSGQVVLNLGVDAVDSNGHSAPIPFQLTTGTVVVRNSSGILISRTGESRADSGFLHLVGIGKIPDGYRNGAATEIVMIDIVATLHLASSNPNASSASGGGL